MKIAILTQPLGHNYGGIMQAWALQRTLIKLGHNPKTINRQTEQREAYHKFKLLLGIFPFSIIGKILKLSGLFGRRSAILINTNYFIRQNLLISAHISSTNSLKKHFLNEKYDAVIVGSDQTWRPLYSPNIFNYFLDFATDLNIKRIAYATSFGVDKWEYTESQSELCSKLAKKFDAVSVRELTGVTLCKKHLGVEAITTLDPTLLLTKEDYFSILDKSKQLPKKKGICKYFLDKNSEKEFLSNFVSSELSIEAFSNQAPKKLEDYSGGDIKPHIMLPVPEWISGFAYADFVITDSFHGMVFSIIFNKPFMVIKNKNRGVARFESLLSQLGIEERIIDETEKNPKILKSPPLSMESLLKLEALRENSISFLTENLKK